MNDSLLSKLWLQRMIKIRSCVAYNSEYAGFAVDDPQFVDALFTIFGQSINLVTKKLLRMNKMKDLFKTSGCKLWDVTIDVTRQIIYITHSINIRNNPINIQVLVSSFKSRLLHL